MGRVTEHSPEHYPWSHPDVLPHAVASAGWGERYPAIHYHGGFEGRTIPPEVIKGVLSQKRFAIAVWQGILVSFIDISHVPERTFATESVPDPTKETDWANVKYFSLTPAGGPMLTKVKDGLDPRDLILDIHTILATRLGAPPCEPTDLVGPKPITEILLEFPGHREDRELRLNTTIGALGGVSTQEYLNTIYSRPKV